MLDKLQQMLPTMGASRDLAAIGAFVAVFIVILLLGKLLFGRHDPKRRDSLVLGWLTLPLASMLPQLPAQREALQRELNRAGYYRPKARQEYLAIRNALLLGGLSLTAIWVLVTVAPGSNLFITVALIGVAVTIVLCAIPRLLLHQQAASRVQRIQAGLPDALDIVTMCLSGGLPLQGALERVSREIEPAHPDLAWEFDVIRRQAGAGTLELALNQFAQRIDVPEIKSLTALVSQAERLGTNVSVALGDYADSVRRNHRQRAEERGNTASIKMLLPVVLCLAPPVYILLLAPALLQMRSFIMKERSPGGILAPTDLGRTTTAPTTAPQAAPALIPIGDETGGQLQLNGRRAATAPRQP